MSNEIPNITGSILLDAGTNELEVLVFRLAGGTYGVNVAKVREVIKPLPLVASPHQPPTVLGMFNIRGSVLPVIDLAKHLALRDASEEARKDGRVIITEFNGFKCAFLVDAVEQIHRVSWSDVRPAPDVACGTASAKQVQASSITGLIEMSERLVLMIDFESVADAIQNEKRLRVGNVPNPHNVDRGSKRVILAEDSPFMRQLIKEVFLRNGYAKVEVYGDGAQAWEALNSGQPAPAAIVSDIEMPRMDGLYLTKRIRETASLRSVPVVLFSSLISDDNRKKGEQVGATAQTSKPELMEMVQIVDRVIAGLPAIPEPAAKAA